MEYKIIRSATCGPVCPFCKTDLEDHNETWGSGDPIVQSRCPKCAAIFVYNHHDDKVRRFRDKTGTWHITGAAPQYDHEPNPRPLPIAPPSIATNTWKARIDLVPPVAVYSMAEALTYGADKHGENNWRENRIDIVKRTGSALRHIMKFLAGRDTDEESGVHHLGCAMASLAVVLESIRIHRGIDNRWPMARHRLTDAYQE